MQILGHINEYPTMYYFMKPQTHSVNDSVYDFD